MLASGTERRMFFKINILTNSYLIKDINILLNFVIFKILMVATGLTINILNTFVARLFRR